MKKIILLVLITILLGGIYILNNNNNNNNNNKISIDNNIINYKKELKERYINYKKKNKNLSDLTIIIDVGMNLDIEPYTNIKPTKFLNSNYMLVNKYNYLDKNYVPKNLEEIDNRFSLPSKKLVHEARVAFENMAKNASKKGLTIRAISTYRTYSYQKELYDNYKREEGIKKADTYSARPGFSEHQTGLVVDIDNKKDYYENFDKTKEFTWISNNAYKYGFILRYPKNKEYITKYMYESWHYRYVGIDIASFIKKNNITFEEYYVKFIDTN